MAIAPVSRGFGYAVFEGAEQLIDWGTKQVAHDKNPQSLLRVAVLLQLYRPSVLVLEDYDGPGSRRAPRIRALIDTIRALAKGKRIRVVSYSRGQIRSAFPDEHRPTKEWIARTLATGFPELQPWLPKPKKLWQSEDARMAIFDAVSLVRTHLVRNAKTH